MHLVAAAYLFILALGVLAYMGFGYVQGKSDLLSLRNFALLGLVIFQLTSAAMALYTGMTLPYVFEDLVGVGLEYCVWITTFILVFLATYESGIISKPLGRRLPAVRSEPTEFFLWMCAIALLPIGLALRMVPIPLVGVLANMMGVASVSVAAGMAAWIWARRPMNPATLGLLLLIAGSASLVALWGEYGRRSIVAVGGCVVWGAYFSRWRYERPSAVLVRLAMLAMPLVLLVALFTAARGSLRGKEDAGLTNTLSTVASADTKTGVVQLLDGQGAGIHSMWLMEKFPDSFEYRPLSMFVYFLVYPVPREGFWEGKPDSLSMDIPHLARLRKVNREVLTIGPGIIGHAAVDGGFPVVILYAVLGGLLLRFLDEAARTHATQPLVVLPIGCALGQVLGLARGETGVFMFIYLFSAGSMYVTLQVVGSMLERSGLFIPPAAYDPDAHHDGYEDYDHEAEPERWDEDRAAASFSDPAPPGELA